MIVNHHLGKALTWFFSPFLPAPRPAPIMESRYSKQLSYIFNRNIRLKYTGTKGWCIRSEARRKYLVLACRFCHPSSAQKALWIFQRVRLLWLQMALFSNGNKTCKLIMCIESESLTRSSCLKCIEKRMMAADLCNRLPLFSGRSIYFATFCHLSTFKLDNYVALVSLAQLKDMVHTLSPILLLRCLLKASSPKHQIYQDTPHTHPPCPNTSI